MVRGDRHRTDLNIVVSPGELLSSSKHRLLIHKRALKEYGVALFFGVVQALTHQRSGDRTGYVWHLQWIVQGQFLELRMVLAELISGDWHEMCGGVALFNLGPCFRFTCGWLPTKENQSWAGGLWALGCSEYLLAHATVELVLDELGVRLKLFMLALRIVDEDPSVSETTS